MKLEAKQNCPLNNFEPCKQLECSWFMKIQGSNPNTGAETEEWGCAMAWLPILLVENAMVSRQTGAAVESFRNEMVQTNTENLKAMLVTNEVAKQKNMYLE